MLHDRGKRVKIKENERKTKIIAVTFFCNSPVTCYKRLVTFSETVTGLLHGLLQLIPPD